MTTVTPTRPPAASPGPRPAPAGGAGGPATIDPVRLLKQHKFTLLGAAVVGLLVGVGAYYLLLYLAPQYRATYTYMALPRTDVQVLQADVAGIEIQEMDRFTQTQARVMGGERVIRSALDDPKVRNDTRWGEAYKTETGRLDLAEAAKAFREMVSSRVIAGTSIMELSVAAPSADDAQVLVNCMHEAYWRDLQQQTTSATRERRDALIASENKLTGEITTIDGRMRRILEEKNINSLETGGNVEQNQLVVITPQIVDLTSALERLQTDLTRKQEQLKAEGGIQYDDALLEEVESGLTVVQALNAINEIKTLITSKQQTGLGDSHREIVQLRKQLEAREASLQEVRETEKRKAFEGQLERLRQTIEGSRSQLRQLNEQRESLVRRREDIVRALAEYDQLRNERADKSAQLQDVRKVLEQVRATEGLVGNERIGRMRLLDRARRPEQVSFPRLPVMLAAGFVLVMGAVTGVIVLREVVDQRIKGPSDIALIPRLRLLGLIPNAQDDPGKPANPETAFRDCPAGAVAEAFRQLKPAVVKRMQQSGHKSLLIIGAMPGSGSTSVTANLAMACAGSELRVLVVDANFRRPGLHKHFKLAEGPGLGEILARKATLEQAVQQTAVDNVSLLAAGTASTRGVPERLATEAMTQLVREAGEKYDLVLIDTAPAMVAGDGQALANRCDAVMLVVKALAEKKGLVARIRDQLGDSRAEFLGVVINAVRASAGGYLRGNIRTSYEYQNTQQSA